MLLPRVIPCVLLKNSGFVKTRQFKDPRYLGDPINILKIFNEKEVDEIVVLDITATTEGKKPNFSILAQIASECFMPLAYGGGLKTLQDIEQILMLGFEKVSVNTHGIENPDFINEAAKVFGSQSVVASIDYRRKIFDRYEVMTRGGKKGTGFSPVECAKRMADYGAGEIMLNCIDRDGMRQGYDLDMLEKVSRAVRVPVIACGGAGSLKHLVDGIKVGHASAVAAGSFFVFHGPHLAVLINVPPAREIRAAFQEEMHAAPIVAHAFPSSPPSGI